MAMGEKCLIPSMTGCIIIKYDVVFRISGGVGGHFEEATSSIGREKKGRCEEMFGKKKAEKKKAKLEKQIGKMDKKKAALEKDLGKAEKKLAKLEKKTAKKGE